MSINIKTRIFETDRNLKQETGLKLFRKFNHGLVSGHSMARLTSLDFKMIG